MTSTETSRTVDARATFERVEPLTGNVATTSPATTVAEATAVVDRAAAAFPAWSQTLPAERRRLLNRAADLLEQRIPDLQRLMTAEVGATKAWVHHNTVMGVNNLREAAALTTQIGGDIIPSNRPGVFNMAIRRPMGVTLGIAPWNGTMSLATRSVAVPLACGNTAVMRGSELSPGSHLLLGEVLTEAGFPEGVANVIVNAPADGADIVRALVEHPAVRHVNFTGSTKVGRIVAELAARHLKPVLLELGGKNSLIVLRDADLDAAVDAAVFSSFMYQGQVCMTAGRIVADEPIADELASRLAERAAALRVGDPRKDDGTDLACLIGEPQAAAVAALVEDAVAKGATLLTGGERTGTFMRPAVLDHVTPAMRVYREETFGPVAAVVRARDAEHALEIANDTEYGLSGAIFTKDVTRALELTSRWATGNVHINGPTLAVESQTPYGGVKDSGYGRFGGTDSVKEFTTVQLVTLNRDQHYPL
ncbi:aldehyde dehydrogenase family protein [Streptomyces sp. NPDC048106]|uniref:aldehyde dehydrogenase family protein n=1 Tax=Streptomyces sp. NPDC048106 TaxID=3155750 RepID=UPI003456F3F0